MNRLAGRRVIVTGGGQGIGAAIVRTFAAEAAGVAVLDGCAEAAARLAEEIGGHGYAVDLSDVAGTRDVMERAIARLGGLDVLVNNAGRHAVLRPARHGAGRTRRRLRAWAPGRC